MGFRFLGDIEIVGSSNADGNRSDGDGEKLGSVRVDEARRHLQEENESDHRASMVAVVGRCGCSRKWDLIPPTSVRSFEIYKKKGINNGLSTFYFWNKPIHDTPFTTIKRIFCGDN